MHFSYGFSDRRLIPKTRRETFFIQPYIDCPRRHRYRTETIEKILQQVATLKPTIYDPGTVISPYVIAIQSLDTMAPVDWQKLQEKADKAKSSFKAGSK